MPGTILPTGAHYRAPEHRGGLAGTCTLQLPQGIDGCSPHPCPTADQASPAQSPTTLNQFSLQVHLYRHLSLTVGSLALWGHAQQDADAFILEVLGRDSNVCHAWTVLWHHPVTYHFYLLSPTLSCLFGLLLFLLLFLFLFAQLLWWWGGRGWWGHSLLIFTLRLSLPLLGEHVRHTVFQRNSSDGKTLQAHCNYFAQFNQTSQLMLQVGG